MRKLEIFDFRTLIGPGQDLRFPGCFHCPAPIDMFPKGDQIKRKGWGCFIYDTYMDNKDIDGQYVMPLSRLLGTAEVGNFRWVKNSIENFCIGFDFDLTSGGWAWMGVVADKSRNKATKAPQLPETRMNRSLDGDGVAPNEDGRLWNFQAR